MASLELDALLLHFLAGAHKDVGRQLVAPGRGDVGELLQKDRLTATYFLPAGLSKKAATSAISFSDICEARSVAASSYVCCARLVEFGLNRSQGLAQRILDFRPGPGDVGFELRHHAGNDERNRLLDADVAEDRVGGGDGGRRRRGRRGGGAASGAAAGSGGRRRLAGRLPPRSSPRA